MKITQKCTRTQDELQSRRRHLSAWEHTPSNDSWFVQAVSEIRESREVAETYYRCKQVRAHNVHNLACTHACTHTRAIMLILIACNHTLAHIRAHMLLAHVLLAHMTCLHRKKRGRPRKTALEALSDQDNEYELQRRANIAKNAVEMARLGIELPQPKVKRSYKGSRMEGPTGGTRKSRRLSKP
jgi:hypothetical protein